MEGPIAFVVMPFGLKKTGIVDENVPVEVDFDRVWEHVYKPVLAGAGYEPVRADRDVGALIISEMIQRIAVSHLVVADVTLPNANVYYEVGVRHAAKEKGCVLVGATWADTVFDLKQMRQLRFPLADGTVGDAAAEEARNALHDKITELSEGQSPVWASVPGFPSPDLSKLSAFEEYAAQLSNFDADVQGARSAPSEETAKRALAVLDKYGQRKVITESVVLALIRLVRDKVGWPRVLEYVATLPPHVAGHPLVVEQRCLALAKAGDPATAVGQLEQLIKWAGRTPERMGLLGGRYKELRKRATTEADKRRYLSSAIDSYQAGMDLDLNEYYCASNLPRLYRARANPGDERLASEAAMVTLKACRRGMSLNTADEWARSTLLGMAFDRADLGEAERICGEIEGEGPGPWQLESTLNDVRGSVALIEDEGLKEKFDALLVRLEALLPPPPPDAAREE
jgi:hypothetical protein